MLNTQIFQMLEGSFKGIDISLAFIATDNISAVFLCTCLPVNHRNKAILNCLLLYFLDSHSECILLKDIEYILSY